MSIESRFFDYDVEPDASRVIKAPARTPEDHAAIARARYLAVVIALFAIAGLVALLELFGARSLRD